MFSIIKILYLTNELLYAYNKIALMNLSFIHYLTTVRVNCQEVKACIRIEVLYPCQDICINQSILIERKEQFGTNGKESILNKLEYLKGRVDLTSNIDTDMYRNTEMLLEIYKMVFFRIKRKMNRIDEECYFSDRKRLTDLVHSLIDCDTQIDKNKLYEKLISIDESLCLMEIMEDALIALKDYPDNGEIYYRILRYRYFDSFKNTHEEIQELCNLSRTSYYRLRKKAILNYAVMLWGYTIPDLGQSAIELTARKKAIEVVL
jgi:hypothetical protein